MSLTRKLIHGRHTVWALTIAAAVFGLLAYLSLPMQLFPDTAPPLVNVLTIYPGASAEDVAENLSRPLEDEFASVDGVYSIKSTSQGWRCSTTSRRKTLSKHSSGNGRDFASPMTREILRL